jgi:hypothetical protein
MVNLHEVSVHDYITMIHESQHPIDTETDHGSQHNDQDHDTDDAHDDSDAATILAHTPNVNRFHLVISNVFSPLPWHVQNLTMLAPPRPHPHLRPLVKSRCMKSPMLSLNMISLSLTKEH